MHYNLITTINNETRKILLYKWEINTEDYFEGGWRWNAKKIGLWTEMIDGKKSYHFYWFGRKIF